MTRDEIIRMAREAGYGDAMADLHAPALERFAALVATEEREQCKNVCQLVAKEIDDTNGTATYLAAAISARGQA